MDLVKILKNLTKPVIEPKPCGNKAIRCSNCHLIGHKAEGNYGKKSCPNPPCTNYFRCGQDKFHSDYRLENRQIEDEIRKEVKTLEQEKESVASYTTTSHSFNSIMRSRLKATNMKNYSNSAILMKDLIILKKHYNSIVPAQNGTDKEGIDTVLKENEPTVMPLKTVKDQVKNLDFESDDSDENI